VFDDRRDESLVMEIGYFLHARNTISVSEITDIHINQGLIAAFKKTCGGRRFFHDVVEKMQRSAHQKHSACDEKHHTAYRFVTTMRDGHSLILC
jgi:hypothetical protein